MNEYVCVYNYYYLQNKECILLFSESQNLVHALAYGAQ